MVNCKNQSNDRNTYDSEKLVTKQNDEVLIKRYCQTLELKDDPELIEEYLYWHKSENVWKEIVDGIKEVGILDMEIYLFKTRLFMIVEVPLDFDWDTQMAKLATLPRQAEWEAFVSKYQKSSHNATSDEKWQMMDLIYKLTDCNSKQ